MSKVILVDVDGTIANGDHREHYLTTKPKNWKAYKDAADLDTPYDDVIWLVKTLKKAECTILIVTARSGDQREQTRKWLDKRAGLAGVYDKMYMREAGDYRDDGIVKKEILEAIRQDGYDPFMVLDDRNRVVKMWREEGIRCLQVQEGEF
jgi:phosphoglycolate phosphatase-like HAD superfamily hydrolase